MQEFAKSTIDRKRNDLGRLNSEDLKAGVGHRSQADRANFITVTDQYCSGNVESCKVEGHRDGARVSLDSLIYRWRRLLMMRFLNSFTVKEQID